MITPITGGGGGYGGASSGGGGIVKMGSGLEDVEEIEVSVEVVVDNDQVSPSLRLNPPKSAVMPISAVGVKSLSEAVTDSVCTPNSFFSVWGVPGDKSVCD